MTPLTAFSAEKQPECDHESLVARPTEKQSYEMMWCGVWLDCPNPRCHYSELRESASNLLNLLRWRVERGRYPDWMYPESLRGAR